MDSLKGMSVERGVTFVMAQLSQSDIMYAKKNEGFAGLHDLCDANMLLPHVDDEDVEVSSVCVCSYYNKVMDAFNERILS